MWNILKFGGTSVSSRDNWEKIIQIIEQKIENKNKIMIVHSALSGITDLLEKFCFSILDKGSLEYLNQIKNKHYDLCEQLEINDKTFLNPSLDSLYQYRKGAGLLNELPHSTKARILATGELLATQIGYYFINRKLTRKYSVKWLDARELLIISNTKSLDQKKYYLDNNFQATYNSSLDDNLSKTADIFITQGFIGGNGKGETVLFGRGGSDTSASYFGCLLGAREIEIWTDVPGIFTANPRIVKEAKLISALNYEEAQEIASSGAKVLHPKCIIPARDNNICLSLHSTFNPELKGTYINGSSANEHIKSISVLKEIILITVYSSNMWHQSGFLADLFTLFKKYELSIDLIATSELSVSFTLDQKEHEIDRELLNNLLSELEEFGETEIVKQLTCVSLVGSKIQKIIHKIGKIFELFRNYRVYMISHSASDINLSFVVEENSGDQIVIELHKLLFPEEYEKTLIKKKSDTGENDTTLVKCSWWYEIKEKILALFEHTNYAYIYSREQIVKNYSELRNNTSINKIFFSVKANNNKDIMRILYGQGACFECVSINELELCFSLFPEIDRKRIAFSPNFAPRNEYEKAIFSGVYVIIDNFFILKNWISIFTDKNIMLRFDTGITDGHHPFVQTGGQNSKFGIPSVEAQEVFDFCRSHNIHVLGIHSHCGSGIKDPEIHINNLTKLLEIAELEQTVNIINIGGGFGIEETGSDAPYDFTQLKKYLMQIKARKNCYDFWCESGRFIIANACILGGKVTQTKSKGSKHFTGLNFGMNALIRPILYGAKHEIFNLSKMDKPCETRQTSIVGPICESGDVLACDIELPDSEENDILIFLNTGAYGKVMSNNYNLRESPVEIIL